jgi:NifU-like protein
MLTELVIGKTVDQAAAVEKDDLLAEMPIPLTPVRLKCAILGLATLKMGAGQIKGRRSLEPRSNAASIETSSPRSRFIPSACASAPATARRPVAPPGAVEVGSARRMATRRTGPDAS